MCVCVLNGWTQLDTDAQKKRKDYTFCRVFDKKPSSIPGCPDRRTHNMSRKLSSDSWLNATESGWFALGSLLVSLTHRSCLCVLARFTSNSCSPVLSPQTPIGCCNRSSSYQAVFFILACESCQLLKQLAHMGKPPCLMQGHFWFPASGNLPHRIFADALYLLLLTQLAAHVMPHTRPY